MHHGLRCIDVHMHARRIAWHTRERICGENALVAPRLCNFLEGYAIVYGTRCVYERSFQVFIDVAAFSETRYRRAAICSRDFATCLGERVWERKLQKNVSQRTKFFNIWHECFIVWNFYILVLADVLFHFVNFCHRNNMHLFTRKTYRLSYWLIILLFASCLSKRSL